MTDKEIKTAVKYAESWLNTGRECYEGYALERHATQYAKYVIALAQDLAALKEKYRWRKQSEEPAPEGGAEALIKAGGELVIAHAIVLNDDTAFEKVTGRRIYLEFWRPLDLPEVDANAE